MALAGNSKVSSTGCKFSKLNCTLCRYIAVIGYRGLSIKQRSISHHNLGYEAGQSAPAWSSFGGVCRRELRFHDSEDNVSSPSNEP